jgi:subtilisin-like proprotein convertase family protein
MKKILGLGLVALTGCGQKVDSKTDTLGEKVDWTAFNPNLVYGNDDRLDTYQVQNQVLRNQIKSTVALIESSNLVSTVSGHQIRGQVFGNDYNLCSDEPFREQTTAAFCSGSLVGEDLVMTAGHCITSAADCASTMIAFDFELSGPGQESRVLPNNAVYKCQSIIKREVFNSGRDYAIIKLDRVVEGRKPLALRRSGAPAVGDEIHVIGHPAGLPKKLAGGARVRSLRPEHFIANLDTYGGNSGSAVFNSRTGLIEGILVRGDTDFVSRGSCMVSNRCSDTGCRGEDVTLASFVLAYVPELPTDEDGTVPPPAAQTERFSSQQVVSIPDFPGVAVESQIAVVGVPGSRTVQVQVDVSHTWIGDLELSLIAPDGSTRVLHSRTGRDKDDIKGTYGVDLTAAQSLSVMSNVSQTGVWKLRVQDKARSDIGKIKSWSLVFKANP